MLHYDVPCQHGWHGLTVSLTDGHQDKPEFALHVHALSFLLHPFPSITFPEGPPLTLWCDGQRQGKKWCTIPCTEHTYDQGGDQGLFTNMVNGPGLCSTTFHC